MSTTIAYKTAGQTIGLSVTASSHTAVTINSSSPDANGLLFSNTATGEACYVNYLSATTDTPSPTASAATVPGDGTAGSLPVLAYSDRVVGKVRFPVSVTAIASVAGPTLMTVTPIVLL